jgi:hypothetical protein
MTRGTKGGKGAPGGLGAFVERMTEDVKKVTLLIAAVGALAGAVYATREKWSQLLTIWQRPSGSCVRVDTPSFPDMVKLSEWDNARIKLSGRNECPAEFGLYVTFRRHLTDQPLFVVKSPHADLSECKGLSSELVPECWDFKKPITRDKGEWKWEVQLPPIERLRDFGVHERLQVSWTVRNFDDPKKPAIVADTTTIEVQR